MEQKKRKDAGDDAAGGFYSVWAKWTCVTAVFLNQWIATQEWVTELFCLVVAL